MTDSERKLTGSRVAEVLAQHGIDRAFGVLSIHNVVMVDSFARSGVSFTAARSELGATNMADGYARASGRIGVSVTSTGPGAAMAVAGLQEALSAGSPVLHLTGQIESRYIGKGWGYIHETPHQQKMLEAVSKLVLTPDAPNELLSCVARAIGIAMEAPQGPVSVQMPVDFQYANAEDSQPVVNRGGCPEEQSARTRRLDAGGADAEAGIDSSLERAVEVLRSARRPVIWCGRGAIASMAGSEVTALAERLGAAVLTSRGGRGVIAESHPLSLGSFITSPAIAEFLASADALLAIGTGFRGTDTHLWKVRIPRPLIQIDVASARMNLAYPADIPLLGDARWVLRSLLTRLSGHTQPDPEFRQEISRARSNAILIANRSLGMHAKFASTLHTALPKESRIVCDVTLAANTWASTLLEISHPRTFIAPVLVGMGQGLATAIGASTFANGAPTILLVGDGGFLENCGELATAVDECTHLIICLFNDHGYGILRNIQDVRFGGRHVGSRFVQPSFAALASAFGMAACDVKTIDSFAEALDTALGSRRPTLIEIDVASIGDYAVPYTGSTVENR
jgi:acetolactate synthase-1/2/3 large subunit